MTQEEMWSQYRNMIVARAKEFHRKFPFTFELDEKISIAWTYANRARESFDESKGKFSTYSTVTMNNGLFREINKEIKLQAVNGLDLDLFLDNSMELDERIDRYRRIKRSRAGRWAYVNRVYGIPILRIARKSGVSASKIWKGIKSFQEG